MSELEKIQLLRETFKGRTDAYGTGSKAAVKEPITDAVLRAHIRGKSRVGIYPIDAHILDGSGTWWIAADIDVDELGFAAIAAEAIEHLGISCYIERSRSKGYHVWVFFSEPIEATWARAIISYASSILERDTNSKIYEMFPKQNTIKHTDGTFGYGNYINLPLFGKDVPKERTVFLNALDHYKPYPDQWAFLKSIQRVDPSHIAELIEAGELIEAPEKREQKGRTGTIDAIGMNGLLAIMMEKCAFCREFLPNTGEIHEELWYRWLTQIVCFEGGEELALQLSSGSPKFDAETTRKKIAHAKDAKEKGLAPYTCSEIINCQGWISPECEQCYSHPSKRNSSPAGLPYILKALEFEKQKIVGIEANGPKIHLLEVSCPLDAEESAPLSAFKNFPHETKAAEAKQHTPPLKVCPSLPEIAWRGIFADFRAAHTNTTEASDEFLFASVVTATGAILGRKGWMWYARRLYPNFYSCVVGATARSRKTTAAEKASDLLQRCDPNVLYYRGLASAEGFINLFSNLYEKEEAEIDARIEAGELTFEQAPAKYRAQKNRIAEGVASYEGVRVMCYIPEFSGLLKKAGKESSAGLTEVLLDAYDNPDKLDNPTRNFPLTAPKPSCSIIAATTTGRLLRALTKEETEGGFTNRFSYFIGDRKGPNDDPPEPDTDKLNHIVQSLVAARRRWTNTCFQLHPQARQLWKTYYDEWFYQKDNDIIDPITGRLPDQVRKLSLQYAMTQNAVPEISAEQMEAAIAVGGYWYQCIGVLFKSYGLSEAQQIEQEILQACANGGKSRTELYEYFQKHIDSRMLNQALENLQKVGRIVVQKKKHQGGRKTIPVFRLIENVAE